MREQDIYLRTKFSKLALFIVAILGLTFITISTFYLIAYTINLTSAIYFIAILGFCLLFMGGAGMILENIDYRKKMEVINGRKKNGDC